MPKIKFKYGTMNSSKSANLLMVRHNYIEQNKKVLVFKPIQDTRDKAVVKSRALMEEVPAIEIKPEDVNVMFEMVKKENPACVLVDEVQFLSENHVEELGDIVDYLHVPVIAYGLVTDFKGKLFEGSKKLIELGAVMDEITTVCFECKSKATHNLRLLDGKPVTEGEVIQVGGNESYKPVCRKHYKELTK